MDQRVERVLTASELLTGPAFSAALLEAEAAMAVVGVNLFGAIGDGVEDDTAAIQAAIDWAKSLGGSVVYLPAGNYLISPASVGLLLRVKTRNIALVGDGIDATKITYSSAGRTTGASGSLIYVGDTVTQGVADGFSIRDLTIVDTNTSGSYGGAGFSGITVYKCSNVAIERVKAVNVKGNAAITVVGDNAVPAVTKNIKIKDCIVEGTVGGGYTDGDAINAGGVTNFECSGNVVSSTQRNGIEIGAVFNGVVSNNFVDMGNMGLTGMGGTNGNNVVFSNNTIRNVISSHVCLSFTNDENSQGIKNFSAVGNFLSHNGIGAGIQLSVQSGTPVANLGPIEISGNNIAASSSIALGVATTARIHDNIFNLSGGNLPAINGGIQNNPTIAAADVIEVYDNYVTNFTGFTGAPGSQGAVIFYTANSNWKANNFIVRSNRIGKTLAEGANGHADGHLAVTYNPGTITAANMSSPTQTGTLTGAIVGDAVDFSTDTALPVGCTVVANVTATDTITWRVCNISGVDQTVTTTFRFWVRRR